MSRVLHVFLNEIPVGSLELDPREGSEFRLLESYKQAYPRPVLGQLFLDDLDKIHHTRSRVPPWFSNLLPEGPLRELIAEQARVHASREFFLLRHMGDDLPGAVRIVEDDAWTNPTDTDVASAAADEQGLDAWHFSLAGVQLKFSARRSERGLTIPVSGRGGDWIVKLPDARYRHVPENEHATMRWAAASGIPIPEIALVPTANITGLPPAYREFPEPYVLAVRRFDRVDGDTRVHMEDFAQILGLYPEAKYQHYNYETLARLIGALGGPDDMEAFVRRLVFVVAAGNGDAHHKNWSLIYPDGVNGRLSPAYDLVSTIQYQAGDRLALNLGGSKRWEDVNRDTFLRMARKTGTDETRMGEWVQAARTDIMEAWTQEQREFGFTAEARARIEAHMTRIPLLAAP